MFFGRNEQTVELLQQLHKTRFLAVVGSSGCGKSSLIRAGLIPKLKAGFLIEDRDRWLTATMKPGDSPLRNLAAALLEAAFGDSTEATIDEFVKAIRQSGAETIIKRLAPALRDSSANLLLLIDQFEEIFRFGVESNNSAQREEAEDFVSLMLALANQRTLPIYVVMTMRSDFIGDCDNFYGLPEAMNRSQYLVPRLTRQQRQQAIEGPIHLFGAGITPRLLDRVLNDVGDKSDQLPVMQHALMRTFEVWQTSGDAEVDAKHYESVGTLTEALSRDAEAALKGLSEEDQKITERMFQALTDTDARNRQIRRPAHLSELCAITGASRQTIETIIEEFSGSGRSFLTATKEADSLIDISHESLIRQWERLVNWIKEEIESRSIYLRLVDSSRRYYDGKAELWHGIDLQIALNWLWSNKPNFYWAQRYNKSHSAFVRAINFLWQSADEEEKVSTIFTYNRSIWPGLLLSYSIVAFFVLLIIEIHSLIASTITTSFSLSPNLAFAIPLLSTLLLLSIPAFLFRKKLEHGVSVFEALSRECYWLTSTKIIIGNMSKYSDGLKDVQIIPLRHIQKIAVRQNFLSQVFNIGDIKINTISLKSGDKWLLGIRNPHKYAEMIQEQLDCYEQLPHITSNNQFTIVDQARIDP
ncbi:MAG TPA: PH domain-containing protein [Blastocatellia bacterium]|nr:PH domain-containing protein [Blastocatellia bacterium]